jgi:hypothetical protein
MQIALKFTNVLCRLPSKSSVFVYADRPQNSKRRMTQLGSDVREAIREAVDKLTLKDDDRLKLEYDEYIVVIYGIDEWRRLENLKSIR